MRRILHAVASFLISWLGLLAAPATAVDLQERYPATLDVSPKPRGYEWTCGNKDVWRLRRFTIAVGDQFRVELKDAQVVLGHHDANVLLAAVFPEQPGEIVKSSDGEGEHVTSVWLRFHPARLGKLFPAESVIEQGDAGLLAPALRLAGHKLTSSWHAGGLPMVPAMDAIAIDMETREGPRRFFAIDTAKPEVRYVDSFRTRPLPTAKQIDNDTAEQVFDAVWSAFDREYAMFVLKPDVDWSKLRDKFRPQAVEVNDNVKLADVLGGMLANLKDLHVAVGVDGFELPGYDRKRPLNANRRALPQLVGKVAPASPDLSWSVTEDGIGYMTIDRLADRELPRHFVEVLQKMGQTHGLILDLRYNGGGSEPLALEIAGSFLDRERVYAMSQYRSGPKHADLTRPKGRTCGPRDPWHYTGPVVVLQGQRTMSSAEAFVLMLAQCPQVTTMGDRTAGSSGNPRQLNAGAGITVTLPRWNPLDAEGKSFDTVGIRPAVAIDAPEDALHGDRDPVLEAALKRLRGAEKEDDGDVLKHRPGARRLQRGPRVVAVSPADEGVRVDPVTEIRVRFDQPMEAPEKSASAGGKPANAESAAAG